MDQHDAIRVLLSKHFPDLKVFIQSSNARDIILMWPLNDKQLFNLLVNRSALLNALENGPFKDCYDLFTQAKVPKWAIENFREKVLKFSAN